MKIRTSIFEQIVMKLLAWFLESRSSLM